MADVQGWVSDSFGFAPDFQKQIIAAMIQEPKIFERLGLYIDPNNFELIECRDIFKCLLSFYNKYKGVPNKEACIEYVKAYYAQTGRDSDSVTHTVEDLYEYKRISASSIEYIEEKVKNFISCQALKRAIYESIDDLGDVNKHYNVKARVEKALNVCANLESLGINAYSPDEILKRWQKRRRGEEIPRIPTGWAEFDKIFGGYGAGEVFTFLGPANSGKSMYLVNVGANVLLQKKNVIHFSLEMSEEITVQRYDMRLLGLTKDELKTSVASTKIKQLLEKQIGQLRIKRFPSSTVTAPELSACIKQLENRENFVPDMIIIDYVDIMRSTNKYTEKRYELDLMYQEVRNLAIEFNVPVVTATQMNRTALEKLESGKILTEENVADSYGIIRIVDCAVTINATPADIAKHNAVIYVCKNRDGAKGDQFRMAVDFSRASIREWAAPSVNDVKNAMRKKYMEQKG